MDRYAFSSSILHLAVKTALKVAKIHQIFASIRVATILIANFCRFNDFCLPKVSYYLPKVRCCIDCRDYGSVENQLVVTLKVDELKNIINESVSNAILGTL